MTIRTQIQTAMTARGLNPYTLARAAGVSQPGLSKWLNGKQATITLATVEKVAAAMGMSVVMKKNTNKQKDHQ